MLSFFCITACTNSLVNLSKRNLSSKDWGDSGFVKKREKQRRGSIEKEKVYLKKNSITISPTEKIDNAGSLFVESNPDNYLFFDRPRGQVGDVLTVYTRPSRSPKEEEATENKEDQAKDDEQKQNPEMNADKLEEELLSALPKFESESDLLKPLTKISFKVLKKLPNGDLIVETSRGSKSDTQSNLIRAKALLKAHKVKSGLPLTTDDLLDVEWLQVKDDEATEQDSTAWQDEYTLRLSGFEEAKSKDAVALEKKRKDLIDLRNRLQQRIGGLSKTRQQVASERAKIDAIKNELNEKITELNDQIKSKDALIEEQKNIIKKQEEVMNPEAKKEEGTDGLQNL